MQSATQIDGTVSDRYQIPYKFFGAISVLVWLVATLIFRVWGQFFFLPENRLSMIGMFLVSIAFLPPLIYSLLKQVPPQHRVEAVLWLSIPAMLLDVDTIYFFDRVFPNLSPLADGAYGAWLLWSYAIGLITGLAMNRSRA